MVNNSATRKWSELYKLNVVIPGEGKIVGQVEDFFVKENSHNIYALSVRTRVNGELSIPITGIKSIEENSINLINAQMVTRAIPAFTRGQTLLTRKVVDENGQPVGAVEDIVIGIEPIVSMRVEAFELIPPGKRHSGRGFAIEAIERYEDDTIVIDEKVARKLR